MCRTDNSHNQTERNPSSLSSRGPSAHGLDPWGRPGSIGSMGTGLRRCDNKAAVTSISARFVSPTLPIVKLIEGHCTRKQPVEILVRWAKVMKLQKLPLLLFFVLLGPATVAAQQPAPQSIILASTTSVENSGLLAHFLSEGFVSTSSELQIGCRCSQLKQSTQLMIAEPVSPRRG